MMHQGATTDFRDPIVHRTLTSGRKYIEYPIPPRCLWWMAKMEGTGPLDTRQNRFDRMMIPRGRAGGVVRLADSEGGDKHPGPRGDDDLQQTTSPAANNQAPALTLARVDS